MTLLAQRRAVRAAQTQVTACHAAFSTPARRLAARAGQHPLASLGMVAGVGFLLGRLGTGLPRPPGIAALVRSGALELAAQWLRAATKPGATGDPAGTAPTTPDL